MRYTPALKDGALRKIKGRAAVFRHMTTVPWGLRDGPNNAVAGGLRVGAAVSFGFGHTRRLHHPFGWFGSPTADNRNWQ